MPIFEFWTPRVVEEHVRSTYEQWGSAEAMQEDISEIAERWLADEWWKAGTAADEDMFKMLADVWHDMDFAAAVSHAVGNRTSKYRDRYVKGTFLADLVVCAFEQWVMWKAYDIEKAKGRQNTWDAMQDIMEGSGTIYEFFDMDGNSIGFPRIEEEQIDGILKFGRYESFPMDFDVTSRHEWRITWALGTWVKEQIK